MASQKRL